MAGRDLTELGEKNSQGTDLPSSTGRHFRVIEGLRRAGLPDEALFRALLSFLVFVIAPFVWSILGLLIAFFTPASGVVELIMKLTDLWQEGRGLAAKVEGGSYLQELKTLYALALWVGMAVSGLALVVGALSFFSTRVSARWAPIVETAALVLWAAPYWTYRIACLLTLALTALGLAVTYFTALVLTLKTEGIIVALTGAVFVLGLIAIGAPVGYIGFMVAFSPLYLVLRYVAPLGLILARPDGRARRGFERAQAEGSHFPFWIPD